MKKKVYSVLVAFIPWIGIVVWLLRASCDEAAGKYDDDNAKYSNQWYEAADEIWEQDDEFESLLEQVAIRESTVKVTEWD